MSTRDRPGSCHIAPAGRSAARRPVSQDCDQLRSVGGTERDQVPDQMPGQEDGSDGDRGRLVGEVGGDLRRTDPVGIAGCLLTGIPDGAAPLSRARLFSVHWVLVTAFASQLPAAAGRWLRQQEMFRTAIGSLVTTSRTATPAQTQLWNAWHQCSAPRISTGPCASSAVPMPLVPATHSDQQNQGARSDSVALVSMAWSPHSARIRPVASVTVTTPPRLVTSCATDAAQNPVQRTRHRVRAYG
jgi:hypothetical protein